METEAKKRFRFPIRFKILITLLVVVTGVVSLITFIMANLFHTDKTSYIRDLTSLIAIHTAEEARSYLSNQHEKQKLFTRLLFEKNLSQKNKVELIKHLFGDFDEFISVSAYQNGKELITVYDAELLTESGISKDDFQNFRLENPLPFEEILNGHIHIENSTFSEALPILTLAARFDIPGERIPVVSAAVIRLDSLLKLASRSDVFETFLIDPDGTLLAHTDKNLVLQRVTASWIPQLKEMDQSQSLGSTLEYSQNEIEMVGGFSRVDIGGVVAGVQVRKTAAYLTARHLLNSLIGASLILLIASAVLSLFWSRKVTRPLEVLSSATRAVGQGRFKIQVDSSTRDEIGELAGSFNQMALELENREEALKQ
ncbi:MAG TPA: HAMP domain-containing protein, partial [Nitrospiria bacterium]